MTPKQRHSESRARLGSTLLATICCFLLSSSLLSPAFAQKTKRQTNPPTGSGIGKTGARVKAEPAAEPEREPTMLIRPVMIEPNEGYLAIATTREAVVTYKSLARPNLPMQTAKPDQQGLLGLTLKPGKYRFEITCEDFEPFARDLEIRKGEKKPLPAYLSPKSGTIVLSLEEQATPDTVIKLNGKAVEPARLKFSDKQITLARVDLGLQAISVGKPGYAPWTIEHAVQPGQCGNLIAVSMSAITVTLAIETERKAEVQLDGDPVRRVSEEGRLQIEKLTPGEHKFTVSLPGYESQTRTVKLAAEEPVHTEKVKLVPATEVATVELGQAPRATDWRPALPTTWRLSTGAPTGLRVTGEAPALVHRTSAPNRQFNQYGDFELTLGVQFVNGKGAAWIVRAQDERNYYLFELTTSQSERRQKRLVFYLCRDGECKEVDQRTVVHPLEDLTKSYTITLRAKGGHFEHLIMTPSGEQKELCASFDDQTFAYGGVGLRAVNGLEMFVDYFSIAPLKPERNSSGNR